MSTPHAVAPPPPTDSMDDEALLLRYRDQHDQQAFDALVHRYEGELYAYLRRYLGNAALAEDVFQATFVHVHRKCRLYEEGRKLRPWLYSIATHLAIDALRKAERERAVSLSSRAEDDGGADLSRRLPARIRTPLAEVEDKELRERVRGAVDDLPEHLRSVVVLVFFQGLKYEEAAEVLGIPVGTVKSRVHAALGRLGVLDVRNEEASPHLPLGKKTHRRRVAAAGDPPASSLRDIVRRSAPRFRTPARLASRTCQKVRLARR